jgi:hypothetical protein
MNKDICELSWFRLKVNIMFHGPRNIKLDLQCLDHPPYSPDLAPLDYHLFPGLKKTIESSPFFVGRGGHCCRGDVVGRTTF